MYPFQENIAADPQGNNEHGQEMVNYGIPDQIIDQSVDVKKTIKLGRKFYSYLTKQYFQSELLCHLNSIVFMKCS